MATNERGEILCPDCAGAGLDPDDLGAACPVCGGRKVLSCSAAGCEKAATVEGANGMFVYCGPMCAHDDDNWPGCLHCQAEPQDPIFGPFCSAACEDAILGEILHARLARWHRRIAAENAAEARN